MVYNSQKLFKTFMGFNTVCVLYCTKEMLFDIKIIKDNEFEPTLYKNDIVIVWKQIDYKNLLNQLVFIKNPISNQITLQRVIGKENDWINTQPYTIRVPNGHIWISDNNTIQNCSQEQHLVSQSLIESYVIFLIRFGFIQKYDKFERKNNIAQSIRKILNKGIDEW